MKPQYILVLLAFLAMPAFSQDATPAPDATVPAPVAATPAPDTTADTPPFAPMDATNLSLEDFKWISRPIVVFADSPADPRFQQQIDQLMERPEALIARDVVILTDTNPAARSAVRLALRPRGFSMVLLAKDGNIILRKPTPWNVREITRSIDKQPLRKEEVREGG